MTSTVFVSRDRFTDFVSSAFDYSFTGWSSFNGWPKPDVPKDFNIGVISGASGSGKTTLLSTFGKEESFYWNPDRAIISHFKTPEKGVDLLSAVGLNSIPSWCKPYHVLSTGERFRADLARKIHNDSVIDEFTSVVDRNVAKAASCAVSKYIRNHGLKRIVFASCHKDILEWLEPDWVFNTDTGELSVGRCLRRPEIVVSIFKCGYDVWKLFGKHHYLSANLNKASRCFAGVWNGEIVAFTASITYPSGTLTNAWREHRTVVLPDYQGMGIGTRFSDAIAQMFIDEGKRYFSRTAHIRMGEYRNKSPLWKPTSKNMMVRKDIPKEGRTRFNGWMTDCRVTYSHEYIGKL